MTCITINTNPGSLCSKSPLLLKNLASMDWMVVMGANQNLFKWKLLQVRKVVTWDMQVLQHKEALNSSLYSILISYGKL